ncbi:hypothetical protein PoB_004168200 [Plakobranchus ocellatus]|uniref:Uncharacterized protein n=1 Tax=Plakobranchus ocellatus TaxID=259542 RepID=A0AAV4B7P0_9GAST|nr:hypothetical protein PoB_004168200 [Plakobranchus ocellatus]
MANLAVGTEVFDECCTSTNSTFVAKCAKTVESHNKRIPSAKGKYPVEWQYVSITFECKHFGTITKASRLEKGKCKSRIGTSLPDRRGTSWLNVVTSGLPTSGTIPNQPTKEETKPLACEQPDDAAKWNNFRTVLQQISRLHARTKY